MVWMSKKAEYLFFSGIIVLIAGLIVVGISLYNYVRYNNQIADGEVDQIQAVVTYYDEDWEFVGYGDNRRREKVCVLDIEYEYDGGLYDDSTEECWSGAYQSMNLDILVDRDNPDDYFFERDSTAFAFISIWMPMAGVAMIAVGWYLERSII